MKTKFHGFSGINDINRTNRAVMILAGILVNVLLSFVMDRLGMPLFLDTVGTIAVAALGGYFPGIFTAVAKIGRAHV